MFEQIFDKGDIGTDTADAKLAQRTVHTGDGFFWGGRPCGDFHQKRVVISRDHTAGIGCAAIKPNAHAGGAAIGGDASIIRNEVILRIFGGNAGLQGMTVQFDIILACFAGCFGQRLAFRDQNLRLNNINAGDLFGDRMFDLYSWVDFNEVKLLTVQIHQEFNSAGTLIIHMRTNFTAQFTKLCALRFAEIGGWRALDNFLVAALNRAVPLP